MGVRAQAKAPLQQKIHSLRGRGRFQFLSAERNFRRRLLRNRTAVQTATQGRTITIAISEPLARRNRARGNRAEPWGGDV
jgi:hypothetical protein